MRRALKPTFFLLPAETQMELLLEECFLLLLLVELGGAFTEAGMSRKI